MSEALLLLLVVIKSLALLVALLLVVAYVIYADRKIWAAVQLRRGPNVVGPWGVLQTFADLLKFMLKEPIIPASANKGVFVLAPLVTAGSCWLNVIESQPNDGPKVRPLTDAVALRPGISI